MHETLTPLVRAKESLEVTIYFGAALLLYKLVLVCECVLIACQFAQVPRAPRSAKTYKHGGEHFINGQHKTPQRTKGGLHVYHRWLQVGDWSGCACKTGAVKGPVKSHTS